MTNEERDRIKEELRAEIFAEINPPKAPTLKAYFDAQIENDFVCCSDSYDSKGNVWSKKSLFERTLLWNAASAILKVMLRKNKLLRLRLNDKEINHAYEILDKFVVFLKLMKSQYRGN